MWHVVCFSESALARYFRAKMKKLGAVTVSNRDVPSLTLAKSNLPNAVAFPVEDMPYALAVLDISQPVFTPLDDPRFKLLLREDVTVLLPPGEGTWAVKATLRPFAEELGEKIVVVNAGGSCLPPTKSPSVLRIYIHCAPALAGSPQAPSYTTIGQAWGIPLPCGVCDAITPTGIGKPIITTDEAMTIAEVLDGVVYVLADITHPASNSGEIIREVLSRILEKYLLMRLPKRRADDQDPKAAYVRACLQRARLRRALLQAKAHEITVELERLGNLLLEKTRERERVLSELHCLEQTGPDLAEIEQEWEALVRYPHVKQIKIKGDFLIVHTDEILIQRWGKSFMLGPYEIRIPFDGAAYSFIAKNRDCTRIKCTLTRTVGA